MSDSYDIAGDGAAGAVSYLSALQAGPNYAIGNSGTDVKGFLFRETSAACPYSPEMVGSRYVSQKVVPGLPCESVAPASGAAEPGTGGATNASGPDITDAYTDCIVGTDITGAIIPCSCPSGYSSEGDVINALDAEIQNSVNVGIDATRGFVKNLVALEIGTICCQDGYSLAPSNLADTVAFAILVPSIELAIGSVGGVDRKVQQTIESVDDALFNEPTLQCVRDGGASTTDPVDPVVDASVERSLQLRLAEPVPSANDESQNALAPFAAPFQVNLPANVASDDWIYIPPDGEG